MSLRGRAGLLSMLVGSLSLVACGGGDGGGPDRAEQGVSLAEYVKRADRLCLAGRNRVRAELAPLQEAAAEDGRFTRAEAMQLNSEGAKLARPLLEEQEAIPKPDDKRSDVEDYLKANRDTIEALDRAVESFERGDVDEANAELQRNRQLAFEITRAAGAVGFKQCGSEFGKNAP